MSANQGEQAVFSTWSLKRKSIHQGTILMSCIVWAIAGSFLTQNLIEKTTWIGSISFFCWLSLPVVYWVVFSDLRSIMLTIGWFALGAVLFKIGLQGKSLLQIIFGIHSGVSVLIVIHLCAQHYKRIVKRTEIWGIYETCVGAFSVGWCWAITGPTSASGIQVYVFETCGFLVMFCAIITAILSLVRKMRVP